MTWDCFLKKICYEDRLGLVVFLPKRNFSSNAIFETPARIWECFSSCNLLKFNVFSILVLCQVNKSEISSGWTDLPVNQHGWMFVRIGSGWWRKTWRRRFLYVERDFRWVSAGHLEYGGFDLFTTKVKELFRWIVARIASRQWKIGWSWLNFRRLCWLTQGGFSILGLSDNVMWNCLFRTGSSYVIFVNTELLSYFFEFKTVKKTEWKTLF